MRCRAIYVEAEDGNIEACRLARRLYRHSLADLGSLLVGLFSDATFIRRSVVKHGNDARGCKNGMSASSSHVLTISRR